MRKKNTACGFHWGLRWSPYWPTNITTFWQVSNPIRSLNPPPLFRHKEANWGTLGFGGGFSDRWNCCRDWWCQPNCYRSLYNKKTSKNSSKSKWCQNIMSIFFTTILCLYSTAMVFKIHRSVLALRGGGHTGFDPQRNGKHPLAA